MQSWDPLDLRLLGVSIYAKYDRWISLPAMIQGYRGVFHGGKEEKVKGSVVRQLWLALLSSLHPSLNHFRDKATRDPAARHHPF